MLDPREQPLEDGSNWNQKIQGTHFNIIGPLWSNESNLRRMAKAQIQRSKVKTKLLFSWLFEVRFETEVKARQICVGGGGADRQLVTIMLYFFTGMCQ